jgi:hypothetical protein
MNVLDLTREQLQRLVNESMAMKLPDPHLAALRDEMLEFLLRLWEIKQVAVEAIERGSNIPPHRIIELLDGKK